MRSAPAVDARLGDGRRERAMVALSYGLAGATVVAWGLWHAGMAIGGWPWLAAGLAAWLGRLAWPAPPGRLRWTGQSWQLGEDQPLLAVTVQIDTGHWLLLRLHPPRGRAHWAGVSAGQAGADWHGLRVALQFHAGDAARAGPVHDR